MRRLILLLGIVACTALPAFGQGLRFGDQQPVQSVQTPGGPIFSVPNATINFCNSPANGSPCTNKATTYTSQTLTTACPSSQQVVLSNTSTCVATTDQYGNWGVWVSPGTYTFTIQLPSGASIGPYTVTLLSGGGTSILPLNNTFTGSNNFTGGLNILGNVVPAFSGVATPTDCVLIVSASPLIFGDAGSCGSGGSVVPSPQYQIFAQPTSGTHGTAQGVANLTTDAGGDLNAGANATVTGTFTANGNGVFKGPRPFVDVISYGADPTNTSDSTTAIQSAINAVCSTGGTLTFPQGVYKVTQPQTGSSAIDPVFTIPTGCQGTQGGIFIQGTGGAIGASQQFTIPPASEIVVTPGATPSMGPVFFFGKNQFNTHMTGLYIAGYNQAVSMYGTAGVWMDHLSMSVINTGQGIQHGASFMADNVALTVYDTFWEGCDYCNLDGYAGNTTLPVLLLAGVTPLAGGRNISGLWTSRGGIWESGNILYEQRVSAGAAPGNLDMQDLTFEEPSASLPILQVTSPAGFMDFGPVTMTHVSESDAVSPITAAIQLDANAIYTDFKLNSVQTGLFNPAIILNSGSMLGCQITGSAGMNRDIVNSSGQLVAGCVNANNYGLDMVSAPTDTGVLSSFYNTNMNYGSGFFGSNNSSTPIRMTNNAGSNSTLGISPVGGMVFGGQNKSGYDTELYRSALQTFGIRFAATTAPTSPTATLAAGGSLTSGTTYFYTIGSVTVATTCLAANSSGPTTEVSATPSAGNLTINLGWTPVTTGVGYCVWRGTTTGNENVFFYVSGASANSFSDTGGAGTSGTAPQYNQTFPTNPQFAFNVNTLTLPNLTVTGTCTGCGSPAGLTSGVIPQGNSSPPLVNTSPQLDNGVTTASTLTYAGSGGITASKMTDSGLTPGNCMQASTGGLLTTVSGPCSTGGTVTSIQAAAATLFNWITITGGPVTTTGTLTFTPTTGETSHQVIGTCGSLTVFQPCALVAGDIPTLNQNTTGSATQWAGVTLSGTASAGQCPVASSSSAAAWGSCGSGGGSTFTGMTANGVAYATSSTGGTSVTPPTANGQYACGYLVTAGVAVPPTCPLLGIAGATISGASTSYPVTYADNGTVIVHDVAGSASATTTIPTTATLGNSSFSFAYTNHSGHNDTVSATSPWVIQSGTGAAALTLTVNSATYCRFKVDTFNATTWDADCSPNGGAGSLAFSSVTSGTGTGAYVVGSGGSLTISGSGTNNANILNGVTLSGSASTGNCIVATSSSAADWGSCATLAFPATVTGGTTGHFPSFTSSTNLAVNTDLDDGITTANTLTYAPVGGITASKGPLEAGLSTGGVGEPLIFQEGTQPSSAANQDWCYGSSSSHSILCNLNAGSYAQVTFGPSSSTSGDLATFSGTGGNVIQDSTAAAATAVNAAVQSLSGCNTASFVYTPQTSNCVAQSGGGGANVNVMIPNNYASSSGLALSTAGHTNGFGFVAPYAGVYGHFFIDVTTADNTSDTYNFGIYNSTGTLLCSTGAVAGTTIFAATGFSSAIAFTSNCTLAQGSVYFFAASAITSNTAQIRPAVLAGGVTPFAAAQVSTSSMPSTITAPSLTYALTSASSSFWFALAP